MEGDLLAQDTLLLLVIKSCFPISALGPVLGPVDWNMLSLPQLCLGPHLGWRHSIILLTVHYLHFWLHWLWARHPRISHSSEYTLGWSLPATWVPKVTVCEEALSPLAPSSGNPFQGS